MDGRLLQQVRLQLGLRQAEVARHIPRAYGPGTLDDTTLSRIERGYLPATPEFVDAYLAALVCAAEAREGQAEAVEPLEAQA